MMAPLFTSWQALGFIPNIAGFTITVRTNDKKEYPATVIRGDSGTYYLEIPDGVVWADLVEWRAR